MKHLRRWITGAAIGAFALTAVPLSGLLPHGVGDIGGTAGWYQGLANRQAVNLRALATSAPADLDDPGRARRAAAHYELVCAACHGSPDRPAAQIAHDLWPPPPDLTLGHWRSSAYRFHVLRDGLRRSAMPAWPTATRPDEIWDMVAFLRQMPQLSAADYRGIVGTAGCADCHGTAGEGRDGIPRLDIQHPDYLARVLQDYRAADRASGPMIAASRGLNDLEIRALATAFGREVELSAQNPAPDLAVRGDPQRDIPACLGCHGPQMRPDYPRLLGQDASYLHQQLQLMADPDAKRGGGHLGVMAPIAARLSGQEMLELSAWFAAAR